MNINSKKIIKRKEKPNFNPSGILLKYNNQNFKNNSLILYSEPINSIKPDISKGLYQLYVFEKNNYFEPFDLSNSYIWIGNNKNICDLFIDEPTISSQHAVIQFLIKNDKIKPYLIDLNSKNGTFLKNKKIEPLRYYELFEKEIIKFSNSKKKFILMLNKNE